MSNTLDQNFSGLVTDNEQPQRSSPTRRVAADHSDLELMERSQAFIDIMKQVDGVSNSNLPVLLIGARGAGKQLLACAIHQRSARNSQPFVAISCGLLSSNSNDPEPVGDPNRPGPLEQAAGGTLFLDEVTESDLSFQVKLLRALQTGDLTRSGTEEGRHANVRLIAASSRDLEQEVTAGRFRNDLFQALKTVSIVLPPLRKLLGKEHNDAADSPEADEWVTLSEIEGRYVARVLNHTGGNKQAASRVLSVDRKTLDRMIKRHQIIYPYARQRVKASVTS